MTSPRLDLDTARHSLAWLVIANSIGLLLAVLLIVPELGKLLQPFSYGRWMPLHLNLQLYGWCAIPLLGLLFRLFGTHRDPHGVKLRQLGLGIWSLTLVVGAVSWLDGQTSGKLFLDWYGPARVIFCLGLLALWVVMVQLYRRQLIEGSPHPPWAEWIKRLVLVGLFFVPFVMYVASGRSVYPPINPQSGGPTGVSLLGSSLGLVPIYLYLPYILGLEAKGAHTSVKAGTAIWLIHLAIFGLLNHQDAGNHDPVQLLAISSLLIWLPLLGWVYRAFYWPPILKPWLYATSGWAIYLVCSAILTFMPGILDNLKFTNALVAHSHAAMAGLITSFNMLLLLVLGREHGNGWTPNLKSFVFWQGGCILYVMAMTMLGIVESRHRGSLFTLNGMVTFFYVMRLFAGLLMWVASVQWLRSALRPSLISPPNPSGLDTYP